MLGVTSDCEALNIAGLQQQAEYALRFWATKVLFSRGTYLRLAGSHARPLWPVHSAQESFQYNSFTATAYMSRSCVHCKALYRAMSQHEMALTGNCYGLL